MSLWLRITNQEIQFIHSSFTITCRPRLFSRKFYQQNISTALLNICLDCALPLIANFSPLHSPLFQIILLTCHIDLLLIIHCLCFCVLCRLCVIKILYYLLSRGIMDICSLEINSHSCEVEQA